MQSPPTIAENYASTENDPFAWLFATSDPVHDRSPDEAAAFAWFKNPQREKFPFEQRAAAEKELTAIEAPFRALTRNPESTEEELELAYARETVARAAWEQRYARLWPWVYDPESIAPSGMPYPAGTKESLRAQRLQKKITNLSVLREAELVLEIHELSRCAA